MAELIVRAVGLGIGCGVSLNLVRVSEFRRWAWFLLVSYWTVTLGWIIAGVLTELVFHRKYLLMKNETDLKSRATAISCVMIRAIATCVMLAITGCARDLPAAGGTSAVGSTQPVQDPAADTLTSITTEPLDNWSIDASEFTISSPAIRSALPGGIKLVPSAIQRMRDANTDLDGLLKLFSFCDQAIRKAGGEGPVSGFGLFSIENGRAVSGDSDAVNQLREAKADLSDEVEFAFKAYLQRSRAGSKAR